MIKESWLTNNKIAVKSQKFGVKSENLEFKLKYH